MAENKLNKVVIHELVKEQHKKIKKPNMRKTVLDETLDPVIKLVDGITSLYGKRNNAAHYGTFKTDDVHETFPIAFDEYSKALKPDNKNFLELAEVAVWSLYKKAESSSLASGGYILFADYENSNGRFFIVAMIKQKDGLRLSKDLVPEELTQLDLNRLYQAAKINFQKYNDYKTASDDDKMEINYLSFVSPSANRTASGYFIAALGCDRGTASARATNTLIVESGTFFRNNPELSPFKKRFRDDLMAYLAEKIKIDESVKLSEIERLARKYIPAEDEEIADKIANDLISFLNSEENAVPIEFPPNSNTFKKHKQIRYSADSWDIAFERSALGNTEDAQIYYDQNNKRLILNSLPSKMIDMIQDELADRNERILSDNANSVKQIDTQTKALDQSNSTSQNHLSLKRRIII